MVKLSTHFRFVVLSPPGAAAFAPAVPSSRLSTGLNVKSKSVPFLEQPDALDGSMAGDVGFDPVGFTSYWSDKDWSQQIVPDTWLDPAARTAIPTVDWMRECELKHARMCMLATIGWIAVDLGMRFPFPMFTSIPNSLAAHDAAVANGSMGFLLALVGLFELATGAAIFDQAKGSGRSPGDFAFDPLGLASNEEKLAKYRTNEIKNGRLAMLAFAGLVTQSAANPELGFPYF
jgi:light-harvesting complex I chlorophyll a/b binding protein 1